MIPPTMPLPEPGAHQCHPSRLAGVARAHGTPSGTTAECPCGKVFRVTKQHYTPRGGHRGSVCGCGWALVEPVPETLAA